MKNFLITTFCFAVLVLFSKELKSQNNLSLIARWPYGPCQAVHVSENYAYIANGGAFNIIDISDPASPVKIGETVLSTSINSIFVHRNYAYVTGFLNGLRIIDINDPANPEQISFCETPGDAMKVVLSGDYAYVADGSYSGIRIFNISSPENPQEIDPILLGTALDICIADSMLYVANRDIGLQIYNISDPSTPSLVGSYNTEMRIFRITKTKNYAYLIGGDWVDNKMITLDVSDFTNLIKISEVSISENFCTDISIFDKYAYITDYDHLFVIDISTPNNPTVVTSFQTGSNAENLFIYNNCAYIANGKGGLIIIDISIPNSPSITGSFNTASSTNGVYLSGSYLYVLNNGVRIFDFSAPNAPQEVSCLNDIQSAIDIVVIDNFAYVTAGEDGFYIIDVSSPSAPEIHGHIDLEGFVRNITISGDYVFISAGSNGCYIINISQPDNLSLVSTIDGGWTTSVGIIDQYAYILDTSYGNLRIYDVSIPETPNNINTMSIFANKIDISGNIAYIVDANILTILDLSDPINPVQLSQYEFSEQYFHSRDVCVAGGYAYVISEYRGLITLDVSNPVSPREVGSFSTGNYGMDVFAKEGYVFIAVDKAGLYVIQNDLFVGLKKVQVLPSHLSLMQNYPNPFNPSTTISYQIPEKCNINLSIFNTSGQLIENLVNEDKSPGEYSVLWEAKNLSSGIYFYKLVAGKYISTKKMLLIK